MFGMGNKKRAASQGVTSRRSVDQQASATNLAVDTEKDAEISQRFRDSLEASITAKKQRTFFSTGPAAKFDVQLDRHEAKYVIPPQFVPEIREFIRPFCDPDPHGKGEPPEYDVITLQLDSPDLALHHAKEHDALSRFKLRVRTYGTLGDSPVFMEVKRKIRGQIIKTRTSIPFDAWNESLIDDRKLRFSFRSRKEEDGYLDFVRLARQIGAQPVVLIKYTRESYMGKHDRYARISFDRNILYQPTREWSSWGRGGRWIPMDGELAQNKLFDFSGVVLELKCLSDSPQWMVDLVMHFNLVRMGNCKYCTAVWQESLFTGSTRMPSYAVELLSW